MSGRNLPANTRYLGFLPRQTYESLKGSADLAINITDEPFTLSHVLLEYAASSLPVVSSKQEVLEDFFGDALLYTDSSDPDEIAKKVRMMLDAGVREEYVTRIVGWYARLSASHGTEVRELRSLLCA
jgi:glycosyltransferase involved in cell wall biosynthesis